MKKILILLLVIPIIFFICLFFYSFDNFLSPTFVRADSDHSRFIFRLEEKYGFHSIDSNKVIHSSYYRRGPDSNYNFVIKVNEQEYKKFSVDNLSFKSIKESGYEHTWSWSKDEICKEYAIDNVGIKDVLARKVICKYEYPDNTLVSKRKNSNGVTDISILYFPQENIIWITE